jgi:hypothetical protein
LSRFIRTISQSVGALAVLSLLCTSVAVANPTTTVPATTTTTTATASSVAPASATTATDASAADADDIAQGGPLADVPAGHWAYDAVSQLVKDGLIVGYPDGQFKGNRPMTRYEAAVLTYRAVDQIEAQITAGKAVNQADIDAVKKLIAAFGKELKDVEAHVAALQKTVDGHTKSLSDLKAEADATQLRVNQGRIGFNVIARPGTANYTLNGYTATGAPIAGGTSVAFGSGANNTAKIGTYGTGTMYDVGRIFIGGQMDPRWSYGARLATSIKYTPFDATTVSPSYCTGSTGLISTTVAGAATAAANCAYTLLNFGTTPPQNTLPINLDYFFTGYSSPGGITGQIGRYSVGAYGRFGMNPNGSLLFGGSGITGANIGYNDPHGHFYTQFYYGQQSVNQASLIANGTNTNAGGGNLTCTQNIIGLNTGGPGGQGSFSGINPYCTAQQSEEGGWMFYYLSGPRVGLGGAVDNQQGKQYTFWDPTLVGCTLKPLAATTAASPGLCAQNGGTLSAAYLANNKVIGGYLNGQAAVQAAEGYFTAYFGPKAVPTFNVALTYARHFGVDPFAGGAWQGGDAESATITYASKGNLFAGGGYTNPLIVGGGRRNSNVVQLDYNRFGMNSLANIENTDLSGTTPFENNLGFTGINGLQSYGIQASHWFSDSVRFGFNAIHLQNDYNSQIPIGSGSYVTQLNENQLNAEMYMYFF